jgi:hypothetical protein
LPPCCCTDALVGHYLLGPSIENYSTYFKAISSSFEMMNANYPFEELEPAIPNDEPLLIFSVSFYFYSFIIMHFVSLSHSELWRVCKRVSMREPSPRVDSLCGCVVGSLPFARD